jgi:hypothetical protein
MIAVTPYRTVVAYLHCKSMYLFIIQKLTQDSRLTAKL